jgi:hypothetical protein
MNDPYHDEYDFDNEYDDGPPCPLCYGEGVASPERAEAYLENEREMAAVMRKWWEEQEAKDAEHEDTEEG